jgi:hypothetical protein
MSLRRWYRRRFRKGCAAADAAFHHMPPFQLRQRRRRSSPPLRRRAITLFWLLPRRAAAMLYAAIPRAAFEAPAITWCQARLCAMPMMLILLIKMPQAGMDVE